MVVGNWVMRKKNILPLFAILTILGLILFCWAAFEPILQGSLASYGNYSTTINFSCRSNMENALNATFIYNISGGATGTYFLTIANTSANQSVFENAIMNISALTDGRIYNITCLINNGSISRYSTAFSNVTFDSTPPVVNFTGIINTINNGNYSRMIILNVSASDAIMGINSVYFNMTNSTGAQVNFTRAFNVTGPFYNASINTSAFLDGLYNITVYANDTQLNNRNNLTKIQITVDNSAPRSLPAYVVGIANLTNYSGDIILNITGISDATSGIGVVGFQISNATGSLNNTFASSSVNGSWNATFNTHSLGDGIYNITYLINDSAGNQNSSVAMYNIIFDNTAPTISFSCSPNTAFVGDTVTCTCSATDVLAGVNITIYNSTPDTSDSGTFYSTCAAYDTAGNVANNTYAYSLNQVPVSSSSGDSSSTPTATKNELWSQITPSAPVTITNFANGTGVNQIQIEVSQIASNVKVTIDKYDSKPSAVSTEKTGAYLYLHINAVNLADKLSKATVKLQVAKSWVSSKNIAKTDVALFRFDNSSNTWNALTTTFASEDSSYYYYTVELASFSYFAIASNVQQAENTGDQTSATGTPAPTGFWGLPYWVWMIIGTIILAIIVWVGISFAKKKKGY
ncbi:Bacterial Ig-like domain (group 3) [uncultured archaeon]|nr:Bacterial Ig-like domain (group 3) [uncultured archaeon]